MPRARVTACCFGDGAVAEGEFHESMNLAALWKLPVVFICENNLYAMGTHITRALSSTDLPAKARAYGMATDSCDGMDVLAVLEAARRAVEQARTGAPYFLECRTYRFRAHSMFDTQAYRSRAEVEGWKPMDPLERLKAWMVANHQLSDAEAAAIESGVAAEIADAVAFAEAGTLEPVDDLERFVLMDRVVQELAPGPGASSTRRWPRTASPASASAPRWPACGPSSRS